ncbi:MAG: hypothetical protein KDD50_10530 [Bdellovibrionales bacterium]|nr:hypothetical protein [Bdellovibrionales bacterium]MCB0414760.1 hypothetical protein [Bdellovibrionales bacterium]
MKALLLLLISSFYFSTAHATNVTYGDVLHIEFPFKQQEHDFAANVDHNNIRLTIEVLGQNDIIISPSYIDSRVIRFTFPIKSYLKSGRYLLKYLSTGYSLPISLEKQNFSFWISGDSNVQDTEAPVFDFETISYSQNFADNTYSIELRVPIIENTGLNVSFLDPRNSSNTLLVMYPQADHPCYLDNNADPNYYGSKCNLLYLGLQEITSNNIAIFKGSILDSQPAGNYYPLFKLNLTDIAGNATQYGSPDIFVSRNEVLASNHLKPLTIETDIHVESSQEEILVGQPNNLPIKTIRILSEKDFNLLGLTLIVESSKENNPH